jgi:hypothetical protein
VREFLLSLDALLLLFSPLSYLRIKHRDKTVLDIVPPLLTSLIVSVFILVIPSQLTIFGQAGVVKACTDLLQMLAGFYIASLAAVATFNNQGMDEPMEGDPPTLRVKINGRPELQLMTRRNFLCHLFGYLSLLSFVLYFFGTFSNVIADEVRQALSPTNRLWTRNCFVVLFAAAMAHLIGTTLLGLYYLTDRMHHANANPRKATPEELAKLEPLDSRPEDQLPT